MEARWSGRPIAGIRQLEQQQFRVERGENPAIEPETVIDSRLTPLVELFSSSGVKQIAGSRMTYHWSHKASLGALAFNDSGNSSRTAQETRVADSGDLVIDVQKGFELSQQSRLTQSAGTKTLSSLFETAHGSCREQR
ncbi:hypothetical protein [Synechococcus sp. WH 8109]|uniref:hypothetical protein n=1 Tax=Synechococcus sp. WH 8109 TaxID=166314 RepID=UPI0001B8E0A7|nr:hypothetical protein [Synechococcus sp. WH 8109]